MPKNRSGLDHDEKAIALLDVAEELFLRDGYEATPMTAIARASNVAVNTVYWYFPSKDHLLAAVSERRLAEVVDRVLSRPGATLAQRAAIVLDELDVAAGLTTSLHERATRAPIVAEAHDAFHALARSHVLDALRVEGLSDHDARLATAALTAMIEGFLLHGHDHETAARHDVLRWVLERFTDGAPARSQGPDTPPHHADSGT